MFVIVEGSNGAGKTTLIKNLEKKGYETLSSPNGTDLAKLLRPACRGVEPWEGIHKKVQFLLFSAARLDEYVKCVQGKDHVVVADRWWTSTYVYQCILQGISVDFMEHTVHDDEDIDLVILLDGEDEVLLDRMNAERANNPKHGKCTWTKDEEILKTLMKIYREDLPAYLKLKGIECEILDTTNRTAEEVSEEAYRIVEEKRNG
jgi:thymidylate kinase